ncbi:MAG TPA: AraC family ligand binding domain-containing protein [Longimicrobiaceae bacterium]|nr:AraC family ligand binding domain-containing protein [Longimicrobiaceae bacterium]
MNVLGGGPEANEARFSSAVLHDEPNLRVVAFHLLAGQAIPPHSSPCTVSVQVIEGEGLFHGDAGEALLAAGQTAVYAPGEAHAIRPVGGPLRFRAFIAPRPG